MILNRDQVLKALELKTEKISLGEGEVIVTELSASDFTDLYSSPAVQDDQGNVDIKKFTPALVSMCIVGEDGKRIFSTEDISLFQQAGAGELYKISSVARRLNGMTGDEAKN